MRKRNVGILACVAGIVMGLGISQLNVAGIFEKEPMKVYNSEERKIPESAKMQVKRMKENAGFAAVMIKVSWIIFESLMTWE